MLSGSAVHLIEWVLMTPFLVAMMAGFGLGLIVAALTTRYRAPVGGLGDAILNHLSGDQLLEGRELVKFAVEGYPACSTPAQALRFHGLDADSLAKRILGDSS